MADVTAITCPLCKGKSERQNSRRVSTDKLNERCIMQYRVCLDPACAHRFKAFVTWTVGDLDEAAPPA